jgi:hypothetical protein
MEKKIGLLYTTHAKCDCNNRAGKRFLWILLLIKLKIEIYADALKKNRFIFLRIVF